MICERCQGKGGFTGDMGEPLICGECMGSGVASCCDAAGSSAKPPSFVCPTCGAESFNPNDIRERYCGRCHAFISDWPSSSSNYRDDNFPERACDYCGQLYRGPAVYCSLECATDDL